MSNEHLGLNAMSKADLRKKLAEDADRWIEENGTPELYAKTLSPQEHYRLCGSKYKRKVYRQRDAKQEAYEEWLAEEAQRKSA